MIRRISRSLVRLAGPTRAISVAALAALTFSTIAGSPVAAETFRLGLLHGNEEVFDYEIGVLRLALEHAPGDHELVIVPMEDLPQERLFRLLENGDPRVNIFFSGAALDREERFLQVDIPITRGLLGHRLFLVRDGWTRTNRLPCDRDQLIAGFSVGSGRGWPDTSIFDAAGFEVVVENYQNLWRMLAAGRYDLFNRGIHEAFIELEQQRRNGRHFEVEPNIIVAYRFDYLFYLRRDSPEMHAIVEQGLINAYDNGAFLRHFETHPAIQRALEQAHPESRCLVKIDNPFLSERMKHIPERYWQRF